MDPFDPRWILNDSERNIRAHTSALIKLSEAINRLTTVLEKGGEQP